MESEYPWGQDIDPAEAPNAKHTKGYSSEAEAHDALNEQGEN